MEISEWNKEHIDHIRDVNSPKEVWRILERLFTKKNTARLQLLENELAGLTQGELDVDEPVSEARLRRYLIRGLRKEYMPFVTSVQVAKAHANTSATFSAPVNYEKEWIIDSGCSHHVTGNDSLFSELHQHNGDKVIITADNYIHLVEKEGNVCIASERLKEDDIVLSNVYHVPGLRKNLVSVSQITNFRKYVLFAPEDVRILDNVKNIGVDVLVVGEKRDSLFVMSVVEAYVEKTSRNDGVSIWHARLGHVGYQMLQQISSKKLIDGVPVIKDLPKGAVDNCEPSCYEAAKGIPEWEAAMLEETNALLRNDTSELVPKPKDIEPVTCKWVYKVKKKADGTVNRFKARLVACGFSQHYGLDYEEMFSPVAKMGYAQSLLKRFNMGESKSMSTPMEPNLKLKKHEGKLLEEGRKFRQLVGSLIYLNITRLDIAYSVRVVSQFMDKPQISHLNAAKRILHYVKGTLEYGLRYKKSDSFILSGFVDADWAGDVNDRRSTTGYCFGTGSAAISWCSKKQQNVTLSSTEAEYAAATMATQECVWLKRLISDIYAKVEYVIPIHCDNESAIKLAENPVFHARTKHIEVQHHFVREKVLGQEITLEKVRIGDQVADIFTKALTKEKFEMFRDALGVIDCNHALRGSVKISASY
ncbi:hypothetical protein RJ639_016084 [Escallonia herrerae]|uniref:Reverse transcriptase Ty1/copia-type domain-containing protein n=1 Tax=Escallonia herrerae TaxID=1293975 RepID=A0AA88VG66_9ASTE|nr:hypothetical protein RJ639_016084 [Escallonia herrerae]